MLELTCARAIGIDLRLRIGFPDEQEHEGLRSLMGQKRERKRRFLADNPTCIYCAGDHPAGTLDHVPSRAFFEDRQWPEGYLFPACSTCNAVTRRDEQLIAFLSYMNDPRHDGGLTPEWLKLKEAVANNHPRIFRRLLPSSTVVRHALKRYGLERQPGVPLVDHPLVALPVEDVAPMVGRFGFKLGASLHYRFADRAIIGRSGGVLTHFWTNLDIAATGFPAELMEMVPFRDRLRRSTYSFDGQFEVRAATGDGGAVGLYVARFRAGFALVMIVATGGIDEFTSSASTEAENDRSILARPFRPSSQYADGS